MLVSDCLNVNSLGHLTIGECDTVDIVKEYGTPLYVLDENGIRRACRLYKEAFEEYYEGKGCPLYASKALNCLEICRIINSENMGLDVVSGGELYTAIRAGFPMSKIHFHGNNKTFEEIEMAVSNDVGTIVVDNFEELNIINNISMKYNKKTCVSIRLTPGIDAHTHKFIKTGQIDSKFGFNFENGDALKAAKIALDLPNIELKEVHCHIGSQIFELEPFELAAEITMNFIKQVFDSYNYVINSMNLGGGFGVRYTEDDDPPKFKDYVKNVSEVVKRKSLEYKIPVPYMYIEPGRSIVAEAGITLYKIGAIKEIPNVRTYVSVNGGMCDNPRYALYKSSYTCLIANKMHINKTKKVTIAGKCCESGDLIQENVLLPNPERGDILAILSTGAYNYSMASNYNRIPKPAIVMVNNTRHRVIVKRETYEDLIRNDI